MNNLDRQRNEFQNDPEKAVTDAIEFYSQSPDGCYDEIAIIALEALKEIRALLKRVDNLEGSL